MNEFYIFLRTPAPLNLASITGRALEDILAKNTSAFALLESQEKTARQVKGRLLLIKSQEFYGIFCSRLVSYWVPLTL